MKKVFQGVELTEVQYKMLSWLATAVVNNAIRDQRGFDSGTGGIIAYGNACRIVGVNEKLVYAVCVDMVFTGLQNMNKMTEIVLWD